MKKKTNDLSGIPFSKAAYDYFYLLNRGYPEKTSLKLIGDHYRLSGNQRICLLRGITSRHHAESRKKKLTRNLKNQILHIDGYNVIFTIMNYLLGKTVFIANDGFLRDSGRTYGNIEKKEMFFRSIDLLLDYISCSGVLYFSLFLDTTIENCEDHKKMLESKIPCQGISGKIVLVKHADTRLKQIQEGILSTSDSEIIDSTPGQVSDLPRHTLIRAFHLDIPDLGTLVIKS